MTLQGRVRLRAVFHCPPCFGHLVSLVDVYLSISKVYSSELMARPYIVLLTLSGHLSTEPWLDAYIGLAFGVVC